MAQNTTTETLKGTRLIDLTMGDLYNVINDIVEKQLEDFKQKFFSKSVKGKDILTRKQTAELLGITLPTLREWTKTGKIKCYNVGNSRKVFYRREEVEAALKAQTPAIRS